MLHYKPSILGIPHFRKPGNPHINPCNLCGTHELFLPATVFVARQGGTWPTFHVRAHGTMDVNGKMVTNRWILGHPIFR